MSAPDYIEPLVLWRSWQVRVDGSLCSLTWNGNAPWLGRKTMEARCLAAPEPEVVPWTYPTREEAERSFLSVGVVPSPGMVTRLHDGTWGGIKVRNLSSLGHEAPGEGCSCGVYAVDGEEHIPTYHGVTHGGWRAVGTVKVWGKVVRADRGVRAQYAYPDRIDRLIGPSSMIGRLDEAHRDAVLLAAKISERYGIEVGSRVTIPNSPMPDWASPMVSAALVASTPDLTAKFSRVHRIERMVIFFAIWVCIGNAVLLVLRLTGLLS